MTSLTRDIAGRHPIEYISNLRQVGYTSDVSWVVYEAEGNSGSIWGEVINKLRIRDSRGDESFSHTVDEIADGIPCAVIDSWTIVYEEEKVVICDAFRWRLRFRGSRFDFCVFELGKVNVEIEGVQGDI